MVRGLIAVAFLSLFSVCVFAQTFNIVGDDDYPPFTFIDKNAQVKGIDIELFQALATRLNIEINVSLVPWKRLLKMTKNGDIAASFALFKTKERESFSLFTHPVHYSTFKLFANTESKIKYTNVEDLYGKRIGIEAGFVISKEFDQAAARGDISLIQVFSFEDAFRRLLMNGIDAFVGNDLVVQHKLKHEYNITGITALPKSLKHERGAYFVLSKAFPLDNKLIWQKKFTEALRAMEQDGTTHQIIQKYLN